MFSPESGRPGRLRLPLLAVAVGLVATALPERAVAQSARDYLVGAPVATLGVRAGFGLASARSDIFDFATQHFTLSRSDFNAPLIGADLAIRLTERLDLQLGAGYAHSATESEYRDWTDNEHLPIEQVTRLTRVPVTVSVRAYVTERGERVGTFVWIPSRAAFFVGGGGGAMWHRFEQEGDFIDFNTLEVFPALLRSDGTTWSGHAFAGGEYNFVPAAGVSLEARYTFARAMMERSVFGAFDRIDLSGAQLSAGLFYRF